MKRTLNPILGVAAAAMMVAACETTAPSETTLDEAATAETTEPAGLEVTVHEGDFATIQQFTTPGGISVWLVEEPSIPILSVRFAWEQGEATDPQGLEGLSDVLRA